MDSRRLIRSAALCAALAVSLPASAYTVTGSAGTTTTTPGATTFADFDAATNATFASISGGFFNGGTNPGGGGNWLTVSSVANTATITFTGLMQYFGVLWGSKDTYNVLQFLNAGNPIATYTGVTIPGASYINFQADSAAEYFDSIVLTSSTCCYEVDNLAASFAPAPIPEPSTYALMGIGLAVLGIATRRRRTSRTAQ